MIQQRTLLLAAPIALFFATPSCSTTDTNTSDPAVDGGTEVAMPTPQERPQDKVRTERNAFLVQKSLKDAEEARRNGNLELAKLFLLEADKIAPGNRDVQRAIVQLRAEMGEAPGTAAEFGAAMVSKQRILQQRAQALVEEKVQDGKRRLEELNFDLAIQQFRSALVEIDALPAIDWGTKKTEVQSLLNDAKERRTTNEVEMANAQENEALTRLREAEAREEARRVIKVNHLLELAQKAFIRQLFKHSQQLSTQALREDPNNTMAKDIYNAATKAMQASYKKNYYHVKSIEYLKMIEDKERLLSPQPELIRVDAEQWQRANLRTPNSTLGSIGQPEDIAMRKRVDEAMVPPMSFTPDGNGPYTDAFKLLGTITEVPIYITPDGAAAISGESLALDMNIGVPVSLKNLLNLMVSNSEALAWTVRSGVVLVTTKSKVGGNNVVEIRDVRQLIFPVTEFLPPSIKDIPTPETDTTIPRAGGESDEKVAYIEMDALISHIKSSTGLDYWEGDSGATIDSAESGYLLVNANPEMQQKVKMFLRDMDRFSTSVVTIETKFLQINENFLQEVGVDFRGGGGSGNKGTVAKLDDVTNGNDDNASRGLDNSGTADPAASPNSGFFYDDGGDGDARGRSENYFQDDLGKILTPTGGLTAAWTFLNDIQLNMIFRAVEKNENAQMVNAQTVTVLNNTRGNVSVINQTSYVRDFDVEVAQASFIADPKIDVIHDGVTLDVRPIIRYDRRSVTLVLQPTVAELQRPIPQFTTSLAGSTLPVTLQLPVLTVRSFATTAQVPDGATVLIGGLRTILNRERSAETPFLSKIPILSFFFTQRGVVDESSSLMVMVKAKITDVITEMEATFGGK